MPNNKTILVLEYNVTLGLDITWKLGHLGWKVIWLKDLNQVPESVQNIQVLLYTSSFAEKFPELDSYLHHYEDHQVPIGVIPSIKNQISPMSPLSSRYTKLDYPFTLPNLKDVLDNLVEQSRQKHELNSKISLLKGIGEIRNQAIYAATHDIKTPINIILIAIENIENVLKNMNIYVMETQHIRQAFQEIQEIITTLRETEFSYPYLKKTQPAQKIDICALCRHIVSHFYLSLPMKQRTHNIISIKHSQSEILAVVEPNLFKRILTNLVLNATKFSPEGQEVTITVEIINQELKLCVYDRGIGIPPEDVSRVTEPFYRSSNAAEFTGSGLGLSIVEACVTCQGGRLQIESQLGTGTCITVFFPTEIMGV